MLDMLGGFLGFGGGVLGGVDMSKFLKVKSWFNEEGGSVWKICFSMMYDFGWICL